MSKLDLTMLLTSHPSRPRAELMSGCTFQREARQKLQPGLLRQEQQRRRDLRGGLKATEAHLMYSVMT